MKKYITIIAVIIILAVIAVLGLYLWKQYSTAAPGSAGTVGSGLPSTGTQGSNGGTGTSNGTGSTGSTNTNGSSAPGNNANSGIVAGSFGPLSKDPILNYFIKPDNTVLVLEPTGAVALIANGQTSILGSSTAIDVIGGSFSADGKKVLLSFGNPTNPQTAVMDVASAKWSAMPQGMQSPQWAPTAGDYRIAYLSTGSAAGKETLATIDAKNPKGVPVSIFSMYANDLSLQWMSKAQFVLSDRPSSAAAGSALVFDSSKQTLTPLAINVAGFESAWTGASIPASTPAEGLVSFISGRGTIILQLITAAGTVIQNTTLQTLPTKCAFALATSSEPSTVPSGTASSTSGSSRYLALYCAIPRNTSAFASANLPDDYNQLALFTSDDIYRVNAQNGALDLLWSDPSQAVDVSNVKTFGKEIFFIDRYTQKLYTFTVQQ